MGLGVQIPLLPLNCCGSLGKSINLTVPEDRRRAMAYKQDLISLERFIMCCLEVFILTSTSASWVGPIITLLYTKGWWAQRSLGPGSRSHSRQDLCIWGAKESVYPHLFHSVGEGVPSSLRNSDSRPGPQHKEDTHAAFFTRWELTTELFKMPWRNVQYNIK